MCELTSIFTKYTSIYDLKSRSYILAAQIIHIMHAFTLNIGTAIYDYNINTVI